MAFIQAARTLTDRSGTITLGGTAQTLMPKNVARTYWIIQNQSSGDLWVNDVGGTAAATQPSIWIPAGATYTADLGGVSSLAISIFGATTGQAFMAREGQ
jgi:hypothetical protein